jgi:dihydroneopterin aldolase
MDLDLSVSAHSGRISQTVDYSHAADEIAHLLRFREYRLVEMAVEEIATMLMAAHPVVEHVEVRLEKPEAMRGRARAAVQIGRGRDVLGTRSRPLAGGRVTILLETAEATLELAELDARATLAPDALPFARRIGWVVRGSVSTQGGESPAHAELLALDGPVVAGAEGAALFCCGSKT